MRYFNTLPVEKSLILFENISNCYGDIFFADYIKSKAHYT